MVTPLSSFLRGTAAWLLLAALVSTAGCTGMGMFGSEAPPTTPAELQSLQAKAADAWQSQKYDRSMQLYSLILAGRNIPREARLLALERYTKSAISLGRDAEALTGLESWAAADPAVKSGWEWNRLYVRQLSALGRDRQAEEHLAKLVQTKGVPYELAGKACLELAKRYAGREFPSEAVQRLRTLHSKAPDRKARAGFERDMTRMLATLDAKSLASLTTTVTNNNRAVFPYCLIDFENLRRSAKADPGKRVDLLELAAKLERSSDLADRKLPARIAALGLDEAVASTADLSALPEKQAEPVRPGFVGVALLLPQTGQLRGVAGNILAGAKAGQAEAAQAGTQVDLRVINTDDPGFMDQIAALPPDVTLVGGPLHSSYFKSLPASGELSKRVFLTFMPEIPDVDEGKQAWRFFWSPQDEVNAVLGLPLEDGVKRFGVLYPEDRMGKRLADLFAGAVSARGGEVTASQPYPPQDAAKWGDLVKSMVRAVPKGTDGKSFTSRPDFQAIFIPDGLKNGEHMINQLHFYQADRLIILGPNLWSEAMSHSPKASSLTPATLRFTFCSGVWWPQSTAKPVAQLTAALAKDKQGPPDFWNALGYDFVRFAALLGPQSGDPAASEISAHLAQAAGRMEWTMAPLTWDQDGHARMSLFFLRPSVDGLVPVDKDGFRERLDAAQARPQ